MIALSLTLAAILLMMMARFGRAGVQRLATLRLRGGGLTLLACLLQLVSLLTQQYRLALLLTTIILLTMFSWLNRRQPGLTLVTIGIALNVTVMVANGGAMPLNPSALEQMSGMQLPSGSTLLFSKDRVMEDNEAALAWLGDRLLLPGPLQHLAVWSIGDMFMLVGVVRLLWATMKGRNHVADPLQCEAKLS